jgi:hypothetical protein
MVLKLPFHNEGGVSADATELAALGIKTAK